MFSIDITNILQEIIGCQGFLIKSIEIDKENKIIKIRLKHEHKIRCPICKGDNVHIHQSYERTNQHLHLFEYHTYFVFEQLHVYCYDCNKIIYYDNPFVNKGEQQTKKCQSAIYEFCKVMTAKDIAKYFRISDYTVRKIDKKFIKYYKDKRNLKAEVIGLDEMDIGKGHNNYIHILTDVRNKEVIDIGEGRKQRDVDKTLRKNKNALKDYRSSLN